MLVGHSDWILSEYLCRNLNWNKMDVKITKMIGFLLEKQVTVVCLERIFNCMFMAALVVKILCQICLYHAGYSYTWDAGGTLGTGWGKSEHIIDCLLKVAKLDITDRWVRTLLTAGLCWSFKPAVNSVLTRGPLCPISLLLMDNQVYVHSSLTRFLVFHPRPKCPNTRRESYLYVLNLNPGHWWTNWTNILFATVNSLT